MCLPSIPDAIGALLDYDILWLACFLQGVLADADIVVFWYPLEPVGSWDIVIDYAYLWSCMVAQLIQSLVWSCNPCELSKVVLEVSGKKSYSWF